MPEELNSGPVHTYPDIFENGAFLKLPPFSKKSVSTSSVLKSFLPVHDI